MQASKHFIRLGKPKSAQKSCSSPPKQTFHSISLRPLTKLVNSIAANQKLCIFHHPKHPPRPLIQFSSPHIHKFMQTSAQPVNFCAIFLSPRRHFLTNLGWRRPTDSLEGNRFCARDSCAPCGSLRVANIQLRRRTRK